jgi:hypothetical protein
LTNRVSSSVAWWRKAEEHSDHVVLRRGVEPGESVVVKASLILAQYYEDSALAAGKGSP